MKSSGASPRRNCSTWWSRRSEKMKPNASISVCASRLSMMPVASAALSRSSVEALSTPAAIPAQRARSTIGIIPPCLMSSCPRRSPECSTTKSRRNPVGGRNDSANRASSRSRSGFGCPSHRPPPGAPLVLHTGRLSASTDTRISAFSWVGSSARLRAARRQDASDRANSGLAALAPCSSGGSPQARRPSSTARATPPTYPAASGLSPSQASALSTSEDGTASRRARLPSAYQVNGRGGQLGGALGQGDGPAQQQRLAPLGGDQVAVVDHAQDLAGRREHRDVVHVALEHVEQDVGGQPVSGHGVGGG